MSNPIIKLVRFHVTKYAYLAALLFFACSVHAEAALNGTGSCSSYSNFVTSNMGAQYPGTCITTLATGQFAGPGQRNFIPGETYNTAIGVYSLPYPPLAGYVYRSGYGDLGAYAFGAAAGQSTLNSNQSSYDGLAGFSIDSSVGVSFRDTITLTSRTLAVGTPVSFTLSGEAIGQATRFQNITNYLGGGVTSLYANISLTGATGFQTSFCSALADNAIDPIICAGASRLFNNSYLYLVNTHVGDVFEMNASLEASVHGQYSYGGAGSINYILYADAFNSFHTLLTSETDGLNLIAASGHDYSLTAVPEPASFFLLLIGLLTLTACVGRKGDHLQAANKA